MEFEATKGILEDNTLNHNNEQLNIGTIMNHMETCELDDPIKVKKYR